MPDERRARHGSKAGKINSTEIPTRGNLVRLPYSVFIITPSLLNVVQERNDPSKVLSSHF